MLFIFCADPLHMDQPDFMYSAEVVGEKSLRLYYGLIFFEELSGENPSRPIQQIKPHPDTLVFYGGWMLKPPQYEQLYVALMSRGIRLINDTAAYQHCHY